MDKMLFNWCGYRNKLFVWLGHFIQLQEICIFPDCSLLDKESTKRKIFIHGKSECTGMMT